MWWRKKRKAQILIRFHNANKIYNYNGGKTHTHKSNRTSENVRISHCCQSHCCQSPFPLWDSESTSPPLDALQHCADLWTCCGAAHILIWSYFYVVLPLMSTAIRTSTFSFAGALNDLLYIPSTESV